MIIKENKVIWSFQFDTFSHELEKAFKEGWTLVKGSILCQVIVLDKDYPNVRERYLAVVEK